MSVTDETSYLQTDDQVVRFINKVARRNVSPLSEELYDWGRASLKQLYDVVILYTRIFDGVSIYAFDTWRMKHDIAVNGLTQYPNAYILKKQYLADAAREVYEETKQEPSRGVKLNSVDSFYVVKQN